MIKALIFDADGPLYQRGAHVSELKTALLHKYGYSGDYSAFEKAYDIEKFRGYDRTETAEEMFSNILTSLGISIDTVQADSFTQEFNAIQSQIEASPYALKTLEWLHENEYKTCVLTDSFYPGEEKWSWFHSLGMDSYIEEIVSSFDIRQLKSAKEAYEACLKTLDTTTEQTVFVGHQQYEMDGAKKASIVSIALTSIAIPKDTQGDYNLDTLEKLPELLQKL
jgi:FMN phosphatase YigB (HAD superfamily)